MIFMLLRVGLISLVASLVACSSPFDSQRLHSENAMTIEQIYSQHQAASDPVLRRLRHLPDRATQLGGYTRDVNNELSLHFQRLPNPTIILYVFPHLSLEGAPVPGYSTTFPMYESAEYALPGEIVQP